MEMISNANSINSLYVLQYLRQQQMFNTLFTSIFNSSAKRQGTQEKSQPLSLDNILQGTETTDNYQNT